MSNRILFALVLLTATLHATAQQPRLEFEVADIHSSPAPASGRRVGQMDGVTGNVVTPLLYSVRGGRYELSHATLMELITVAYGIDADTVVGGPGWLTSDRDRFDVIAKPPETKTATASIKAMLQSLLADRFKLVVRNDTKPVRAWVLSKGPGGPKFRPADSSSESACRIVDDNERVSCRNVTMDAFVAAIRSGMITTLPVVNSTGIEGAWDFDLRYTVTRGYFGAAENNPILDAIDKQLGLKLELSSVSRPVLLVESVNRTPTANVVDIEKRLPPDPVEFEVASIRPCQEVNFPREQHLATTQVNTGCQPLQILIGTAWDRPGRMEGAPGWLGSRYFNITAKSPIPIANSSDRKYHTMLRNLLADRFKIVTHYEDRLFDVYEMVADKPKLTKADPSGRTGCKTNGGAGFIVGIPSVVTCQNVTMTQFAEELGNVGNPEDRPGTRRPVVDATGIQGAWDLTLTYRQTPAPRTNVVEDVTPAPAGDASIFAALDKLGLKLRGSKRSRPVFVMDHIEENPTEN